MKKFFAGAALAALPLGLIVTLGAASAQAAAPVTFTGSISCSLVGTITFTPPLSNTQTSKPTTATFKGKNNHCKGTHGTSLTQKGETLKSSTDSYSFTLPANTSGSCAPLATGTLPATTMAVTWIGTSPITGSKLTFKPGTFNPNTGLAEYLTGTSAGSFAGSARTALQASTISEGNGTTVPYSLANVEAACAGSGVKDLTFIQPKPEPPPFSTNDNLEVGKAY
jgi:hypothetical protein